MTLVQTDFALQVKESEPDTLSYLVFRSSGESNQNTFYSIYRKYMRKKRTTACIPKSAIATKLRTELRIYLLYRVFERNEPPSKRVEIGIERLEAQYQRTFVSSQFTDVHSTWISKDTMNNKTKCRTTLSKLSWGFYCQRKDPNVSELGLCVYLFRISFLR